MTMDKQPNTSRPAVTPYKKARKPLMNKVERERQKATFRSYRIDGGGDAS